MKQEPVRIVESTGISGEFCAESPVLKKVKLVGCESRKGRKYPLDVLAKAVKLYEGKPCYVDHPARGQQHEPRSFASKFAVYRDVRLGSDGLYADMHCNPRHALFEQFKGWVDTAPEEIGLSHSAYAMLRECADGTKEVTEIRSVESIDLVANPATTRGLFESMDDDLMDAGADAAPAPVSPDASGTPTLDEAVSKLVAAIMSDTSLDVKTKGKKILHVLKLQEEDKPVEKDLESEDAQDEVDEKDEADEGDYEKKAEESMKRFEKKLGTLLEEAISSVEARMKKLKLPVSKPSKGTVKSLTVEKLLEGYN